MPSPDLPLTVTNHHSEDDEPEAPTYPGGTLETHTTGVSLQLTRGTILPELLNAGAEGGAVALGQTGGGVGEGGQTVQTLEDRRAGDRLALGDLDHQEYQRRYLESSFHHDANIWKYLENQSS